MRLIHVYDPALCCSSGVCGADVDQKLVDFSAAVERAKNEGITVKRHNLATDPLEFAQSEPIRKFLEISGADALPAIVVDGVVAMSGSYPDVVALRAFAEVAPVPASASTLPVASPCCGQSEGCC